MPSKAHPDADLHPVATGLAADIVAAHESSSPHILYSGWFCPFVQRSWIVLEEKGIDYQYVEINPYNKEPEFLELNPRGLVPTLGCPVKGGKEGSDGIERKPLIESNVICEYLDSLSSKSRPLYAQDAFERAREKIWIDHITTRILPAYHRLLQHTPDKPFTLEEAKMDLRTQFRTWIKEANPKGSWWGGGEMGMVDVALAPWAVRLWVFEHFKGVNDLFPAEGKGAEDEELWTRWRKWLAAVQARESVKKTLSDRGHYMPIYQRYADDKAQSEMAKAVRAGRGVP